MNSAEPIHFFGLFSALETLFFCFVQIKTRVDTLVSDQFHTVNYVNKNCKLSMQEDANCQQNSHLTGTLKHG